MEHEPTKDTKLCASGLSPGVGVLCTSPMLTLSSDSSSDTLSHNPTTSVIFLFCCGFVGDVVFGIVVMIYCLMYGWLILAMRITSL